MSELNKFWVTERVEFRSRMNSNLQLDVDRTALVTIDLQKKYLDAGIGETQLSPSELNRVIEGNTAMLRIARAAGIPVIHAYVTRRPTDLDGQFPRGLLQYVATAAALRLDQASDGNERDYRPDRLIGDPQADLIDGLVESSDILVSTKKSWDSFQYTDLEHLLRWVYQVDTIILTGVNTETCVLATTLAAANRGFRPLVIADCVGSMRGRDSHRMALELMARSIAWVLTLEELSAKIDSAI